MKNKNKNIFKHNIRQFFNSLKPTAATLVQANAYLAINNCSEGRKKRAHISYLLILSQQTTIFNSGDFLHLQSRLALQPCELFVSTTPTSFGKDYQNHVHYMGA